MKMIIFLPLLIYQFALYNKDIFMPNSGKIMKRKGLRSEYKMRILYCVVL